MRHHQALEILGSCHALGLRDAGCLVGLGQGELPGVSRLRSRIPPTLLILSHLHHYLLHHKGVGVSSSVLVGKYYFLGLFIFNLEEEFVLCRVQIIQVHFYDLFVLTCLDQIPALMNFLVRVIVESIMDRTRPRFSFNMMNLNFISKLSMIMFYYKGGINNLLNRHPKCGSPSCER